MFQTLGGAFGISAAQCAFVNKLVETLPATVPGINPSLIIATGATDIRSSFTPEEISGILLAYLAGLRVVWAITVGLAGSACVVSFMSNRKRLYRDEVERSGPPPTVA